MMVLQPSGTMKPNPLDLTWASSGIFERIDWNVKMENLGSDHLVVLMELDVAINTEEINVKPKIDHELFHNNIDAMDLKNVNNLLDIILAMDESKGSATIRPKSTRNIKFILKFYWNDEINCLHKLKKFAMVNYFRNMTLKT